MTVGIATSLRFGVGLERCRHAERGVDGVVLETGEIAAGRGFGILDPDPDPVAPGDEVEEHPAGPHEIRCAGHVGGERLLDRGFAVDREIAVAEPAAA